MTAAETIARLTAERDALRAKHAPIRELAARLLAETEGHTPGPWVWSFESVDPEWAVITTTGGSVIANVHTGFRGRANIIIAALSPDMRAAIIAAGGEE